MYQQKFKFVMSKTEPLIFFPRLFHLDFCNWLLFHLLTSTFTAFLSTFCWRKKDILKALSQTMILPSLNPPSCLLFHYLWTQVQVPELDKESPGPRQPQTVSLSPEDSTGPEHLLLHNPCVLHTISVLLLTLPLLLGMDLPFPLHMTHAYSFFFSQFNHQLL